MKSLNPSAMDDQFWKVEITVVFKCLQPLKSFPVISQFYNNFAHSQFVQTGFFYLFIGPL